MNRVYFNLMAAAIFGLIGEAHASHRGDVRDTALFAIVVMLICAMGRLACWLESSAKQFGVR